MRYETTSLFHIRKCRIHKTTWFKTNQSSPAPTCPSRILERTNMPTHPLVPITSAPHLPRLTSLSKPSSMPPRSPQAVPIRACHVHLLILGSGQQQRTPTKSARLKTAEQMFVSLVFCKIYVCFWNIIWDEIGRVEIRLTARAARYVHQTS